MAEFRRKVDLLSVGLEKIDDVTVLQPAGTFYGFADVAPICTGSQSALRTVIRRRSLKSQYLTAKRCSVL